MQLQEQEHLSPLEEEQQRQLQEWHDEQLQMQLRQELQLREYQHEQHQAWQVHQGAQHQQHHAWQARSLSEMMPEETEIWSSIPAPLEELFFMSMDLLDVNTLRQVDATCRTLRTRNNSHQGVWKAMGITAFDGLEASGQSFPAATNNSRYFRVDWKMRYHEFWGALSEYSTPFCGRHIVDVPLEDAVANLNCRLWCDASRDVSMYLELEVLKNADNLSIAIQDDIEDGYRGSLTFSPDTGAVIRDRIVRYHPRKCEAFYVQPLPSIEQGTVFCGNIGLFCSGDKCAFFRRVRKSNAEGDVYEAWQCTGFIPDFDSWAKARWIRPCIAFRDSGAYDVRVARISKEPPIPMSQWPSRENWIEKNWINSDWELDALA